MEIDISKIKAEVSNLTLEDLRAQLVDAKAKQKVATKKYYNADTAKKARQKRSEELKQMTERAKQLPATQPGLSNLYEQIQAEAARVADEKLGVTEAESEPEEVEA